MKHSSILLVTSLALSLAVVAPAADIHAKDLNKVAFKPAPAGNPVPVVANGEAKLKIVLLAQKVGGGPAEIQKAVKEATGVELAVVRPVKGKFETPAILLGDGELAAQNGLVSTNMPPEGFAIKTAGDSILIVGNDKGLEWGCYEFSERFVGTRWYWPTDLGRSVPAAKEITVAPVWLEDAPFFRKREFWPAFSNTWKGTGTPLGPVQTFLRSGNSWPINLKVHQPTWARVKEYTEGRPEVFQLRSDGTRDFSMFCYGNPKTLETMLENTAKVIAKEKPAYGAVMGSAITVSPGDAEIACYCADCKKLWDEKGGQYGSASRILGTFTANLAREVKKRWPDMTVIYLPYLNYTLAPDGIEFPGNVEAQICGMPGMAMYKEPSVMAEEQANVDKWLKLTGRKIQNWHYDCWPESRTVAVYQYPHVVRDYYQANRDKTVGTFVNGEGDHWPRGNLTLHCWQKLLWNPDYDVEAAIEEFPKRMFGPAAKTMAELLKLQMDGWEKSRWPGGRLSSKAIHEVSYPRATVVKMEELLERARAEAKDDKLALERLEYYAAPFAAFFAESKSYAEGGGLRPLLIQKVGENPKLDGKLDDPAWQRAQEIPFVRAHDKVKKDPVYPTTVRAVWTPDGISFGFRMTEPAPDQLEKRIQGRDDSNLWWNDNVEILVDATGKNEGEFYHYIVSAANTVADAKGKDFSWNNDLVKTAVSIEKDCWTLEVFVPFAAFPDAAVPAPGASSQTKWFGNFTRHRVCDRGINPDRTKIEGSQREYTRMNTTYAGPSNNLADFAPLKFVE
jgi:hypothetical protein